MFCEPMQYISSSVNLYMCVCTADSQDMSVSIVLSYTSHCELIQHVCCYLWLIQSVMQIHIAYVCLYWGLIEPVYLHCGLIQHVCFYSGLRYLSVLQTHRICRPIVRPIQSVLFIAGSYNMHIWQTHTTYPFVLHAHTHCIAGS